MKNRLLRLAIAAATLCAALPASAQDGGTQSIFSLGAGSRAIGLGRAFVSVADDASALYWNPAALRNVQSAQLTVMYMPLFGDFTGADYIYGGFVYPTLNAGSFGAGFMSVGSTFDAFDEFSRPLGEANYGESQLLIAYAFEFHSSWLLGRMATGASVKVGRINVDPFSSTAPGADVGLHWIPDFAPALSVGVNVQDLVGAEHKLDVTADRTDRTVLAGLGYTRDFGNGSRLLLQLQADLPQRADTRMHAGAEYAFARYISLRAGYDDGDISFGLGVTVSRYDFDYALLSRDQAGSSHPVSFSTRFGKTLSERRDEQRLEREREAQDAIQQAFESRVAAHRDRALELQTAGDWEGALDEWQIVLEFTPDDEQAIGAAAAARERIVEQQARATRDVENQAIIRTRFAQGLDYFNEGNWLGARGEWQAILVIDSVHAGASDYLQRTQSRIDEAVQLHMRRARQLEQQGRLTEAIAEWNNVQQYNPQDPTARRAISRVTARIESASQDLQAAQRRLRIVNLYNEALQFYNNGDYQGAIRNLDTLIRLQPQHEDARRLKSLAQRKLTPLTAEEKQRIRQLYLRGMQFFSRDEYAKAITEWEKILEIDPTNESVQNNIREARARLDRLEGR